MTNFNASSHKDLLIIKLQNPIIGNRLVIPDLTKRAVLSASYLKTTFYYSPCLAMGGVSKTRGRGRGRGPLFFCFVFGFMFWLGQDNRKRNKRTMDPDPDPDPAFY